jgi:hypothetical protein
LAIDWQRSDRAVAALFGPVKYAMLPDQLSFGELSTGNALVEGHHRPGAGDAEFLRRPRQRAGGDEASR